MVLSTVFETSPVKRRSFGPTSLVGLIGNEEWRGQENLLPERLPSQSQTKQEPKGVHGLYKPTNIFTNSLLILVWGFYLTTLKREESW